MRNKKTTRELLGDLIDIETEMEFVEPKSKEDSELRLSLAKVKKSIEQKMKNLDVFDFELTRKSNLIEAEIQTYEKEIKRLKYKNTKIAKIKEFFNSVLIPMIIKEAGKDNKYETDKTRYTLYETYGPLEFNTNFPLPNKYKKIKKEKYIDKKQARKDAIEADKEGKRIPGLIVNKIERVRKS